MNANEVNYLLYHKFFPQNAFGGEIKRRMTEHSLSKENANYTKETENHKFSVCMNENEKLLFLHMESVHWGIIDLKK